MSRRSRRRDRFRHGVASFDPLTDGVLLWTLVDGGGRVRWELGVDEELSELSQSGDAEADPDTGTVTVEVSDLEPATSYWYRFEVDGQHSPVGRTRTLPGVGAQHLRVGVTCCARYTQQRFHVYSAMAAVDLDVVVHLGDYIYEDCKPGIEGRDPEPHREVVSLGDYRERHALHRRDPELQALHARHPMIAIWDDHDIADNAWAGGASTHDPERQGPWSERLEAALRAHQEFLPKRLSVPGDLRSAWRRLDAGDLVTFACTETRAVRDQQAGFGAATPANDAQRSLLGPSQRRWLHDTVRDRSAAWLLLLSGVVVSELEIDDPDALDGLMPEKYVKVDGRGVNSDQWDGYRAERRALSNALSDRRGGAVILSGDIHSAWAVDGPVGPGGTPVAVELVCPPAATTPLGQIVPPGVGPHLGPGLRREITRARWVDVDHHGYLVLDVDRHRVEATWWWVDGGEHDDVVAPERGRIWYVPRRWPPGLMDPEPARSWRERLGSGSAVVPAGRARRHRGRRLAAAGLVGAGLAVWASRRHRT